MNTYESLIITGKLEKDAEPILSKDKELGCLLLVRKNNVLYKVELFSFLSQVLYRHALKGTSVIIPAYKKDDSTFFANVVYPAP